MFRFILPLVTFLLFSISASSQTFSHGFGGGYFLLFGEGSFLPTYGGSYAPRYNVAEMSDNSSLSVGTKLTVAFSGNFGSQGSSEFFFLVDAPLVAGLNFGAGATADTDKRFGGFLNAGLGLNYGTYQNTFFGGTSGFAMGPVGILGMRFTVRERLIGLSGSYLHSILKNNKAKVIGLRLTYYLGSNSN